MKIKYSFLLMAILLASCRSLPKSDIKPCDPNATTGTIDLLSEMYSLTSKGIMFGHQDDPAYGIGWKAPDGQSDVFKICSDYPAVVGWDLGHLEMDSPCNLDSVPFSAIKVFAAEIYARGGINTFSWHLNNPLNDSSAWATSAPGAVKSILPGGGKHEKYTQWLDRVATFFSELKTAEGKPIPVIFRPFHEQSGDWFWWGKKHCTADEYIQLWQFTVKYLSEIKKVHNLIYTFSPADNFNNETEFLERYPGDSFVDITGFDIYQFPKEENRQFSDRLKGKLTILTEVAGKKNKLPVIAEIGYEQIPYPNWWTEVLWPSIKDSGISYALFWRNAANRPNHYFMPYPGQQSEKDFLEMYKLPGTLFLGDLRKK